MENLIGEFEPLLTKAKRGKLQWFGHIKPIKSSWRTRLCMEESRGERGRSKETRLTGFKKRTGLVLTEAMGEAKDSERWKRRSKASARPNGPVGYEIL